MKPKIKGKIHLDEVVLKEKKEKRYGINAVDGKTGYKLGHLLTRGLFIEDFWKFFEDLREKIYDQCLERYEKYKTTGKDNRIVFVSDKRMHLTNILQSMQTNTWCFTMQKYGLEHNNNPIERYNEDVKQRYKIMRSFKSFESANAFLDLRRMIYNFVRGDETRAMKAGIALELGQNRLQGLIKF